MTEFSCSICGYTNYLKTNVAKHIGRKNKCGEGIPDILEIPIDITCEHCNKEFNTIPNLKRHLKTCKIKKSNLEQENDLLKKQLAEALAQKSTEPKSITNNIDNSTVNHIQTQNNIIINITPYNDPNLEGAEKY